jgi:DNA polymerase epsilon subunit 1
VALFESSALKQFQSFPLGDEMSTSVSLTILRSLVGTWLRDAFSSNSAVADELLQHVYRFVSRPDTLMHDPALHRVVHSLMKSTFLRLLGELQRLGCTIVHATFHKVTVSTNKTSLAQAEEYINFVIATIRNRRAGGESESLSRVALRPRQFHSHYLFLDEYNFGTMHLDRLERSEAEPDFVIADEENESFVIVPSVVTAWSVMHYLGSQLAQEYFRVIVGRFSKEVLRKQEDLRKKAAEENHATLDGSANFDDRLLAFKRNVITKHFASTLTRAVGEILKEERTDAPLAPPFVRHSAHQLNPALEFIKNVIVVLELDPDVENEVQMLKRSLLAQVGVAEYSRAAQWVNPCPALILPDLFCTECHDSRDVNLCYIPPTEDDETGLQTQWICEDCGTPYDATNIEERLIGIVNKRLLRYQLQDLRDSKTNLVVTRCLPLLSECDTALKLDIRPEDARLELDLLKSLAAFHNLQDLQRTTQFFSP